MPKFSALIAVVLAFLVVPALAAAAPTASQVTQPANPAFVTVDHDRQTTLHVAGTTTGGTGDIDLRCYYDTNQGPVVKSQVPVVNGAFATDVTLTKALMDAIGDPEPYCILRAVPAGTVPAAPPGQASPWQGPSVGWGRHRNVLLGSGFGSNPSALLIDFFISRAQSDAINDYDSIASCGLCDTWLFKPGTKAASNPIWWSNSALFAKPDGLTTRSAVRIDGSDAYTSSSGAYTGWAGVEMRDNPGLPAVSETDGVDAATGDLTIEERGSYVHCAPDRSVYPATNTSCASFTDTGVHYERSVRQSDNGHQVTIVDHWKSIDGKPHEFDAFYEDVVRSEKAATAGHEGRASFTWMGSGFITYPPGGGIPVPSSVPATALVKVDASTPDAGDNSNPIGAMTLGSQPQEFVFHEMGNAGNLNGDWITRYARTIPAGGEITLAFAYAHDFALAPVEAKANAQKTALAAPAIGIDSPAAGSTVDAATTHVAGTASSPDGQVAVQVNGVSATVDSGGHWSADVPLSEGANQILAVASNKLGVTTNAIVSVTRPAAPAPAAETPAPAPAATTIAATAKPVRCIVPKLRGKTLAKAKRLLKRAHCRLGKVARKQTSKVKPGRIVSSRFKAGSRHRAGTRVRVTIAKKS
jgi:Glucodextranase, domain B/PASTA domain